MLISLIPDLRFSDGIIQKIHTLQFRTSPHLYIILLMILKKHTGITNTNDYKALKETRNEVINRINHVIIWIFQY